MDFYSHLSTYLDDETILKMKASMEGKDFHAVLLNPNKMSDDTFLKLYPEVKKHPLVEHAYIFDKEKYQLGKSIWHELGCFYIQEPSAMVVSSLLDFANDDLILDMCAAPGGKTIQAAFKNKERGLIIANDLSKPRALELSDNIERLGIGNVVVTNNDLSSLSNKYANFFDKIILDVPCSGSGMFRKDRKMEADWSINKVYKFAELQKELILTAFNMLKPGGILSYSTCSYSYEENEEVIEYLLTRENATILPALNSPLVFKGKYGFHFLPHLFEGEGQYVCQIKKPGTINKSYLPIKSNFYVRLLPPSYISWSVEKFGDYLFGLPHGIDLKEFNVVRKGVKIGEIINPNLIRYDIHFAHHIKNGLPIIELTTDEIKLYLAGNQLNRTNQFKGDVLLRYKGVNVDIGKTDGNVIKNHYPKGLRKIYK